VLHMPPAICYSESIERKKLGKRGRGQGSRLLLLVGFWKSRFLTALCDGSE
jgi:hypothetical protein